jgi:acetyltransferase-like isoleucine patch superfamily enzyme
MDRDSLIEGSDSEEIYKSLKALQNLLDEQFKVQFNRSLPFNDEVFDRWERARKLGFGEKSSIYDNSYVFGDVKVGHNTWIGPFTIIDGSGGLTIGNNCTISSGVHIYTHDNLAQTLTGGKAPIEREPISIGDCTYIGPGAIIKKGVTIGEGCVVGAFSFINKDVESNSIVVGTPARVIGRTVIVEEKVTFEYFKEQ